MAELRDSAALPDSRGYFGPYGGRFVPETLIQALDDLDQEYAAARADPAFKAEVDSELRNFAGRPTPIDRSQRLNAAWGGCEIFLKREDLLHTGAHKINNTIGQILLARRMRKRRIIAETGAGQHGVATATVAARYGLPCVVYMGEEDVKRQSLNFFRMRLLGAEVRPVSSGSRTLKDATNEAIRDWVGNVRDTFYIIGSVVGPHPYPRMVRDFQSVIGTEAREQMLEATGALPGWAVACVGGGSNALGLFHAFRDDPAVRLVGVEAGGLGLESGQHAATLSAGDPGVLHGARSYLLQDADGQVRLAHSISAGLDYPGVGPEHAWLKDSGRVTYDTATDREALDALQEFSTLTGIIPALETAHALAWVRREAQRIGPGGTVLVCLSGRGDKDVPRLAEILGAS
jgi:tryptophan synthase beta chain